MRVHEYEEEVEWRHNGKTHDEDREEEEDTAALPSFSSSADSPSFLPRTPEPYRRRNSDPQTFREKATFRRDHMYGRHRPLPDAPWRSLSKKTYLDDAERLYGRMETWARWTSSQEEGYLWTSKRGETQRTAHHTELAKKVAILRDFLRDTLSAAHLEIKTAKKCYRRCEQESSDYEARMKAAELDPASLFKWAEEYVKEGRQEKQRKINEHGNSSFELPFNGCEESDIFGGAAEKTDPRGVSEDRFSVKMEEEEEAKLAERIRIEARRLRGERASLATSPATDESPGSLSAFPFLRRRALENESTLDPSLVDWTMRYFPEDSEKTFTEAPSSTASSGEDPMKYKAGSTTLSSFSTGAMKERRDKPRKTEEMYLNQGLFARRETTAKDDQDSFNHTGNQPTFFPHKLTGRSHGRQRLECSLSAHEDWRRVTFDAEGVYYHVRPPSNSAEDEEVERRKPKPVRGSDAFPGEVVKVPWNVVSTSRKKGYSSDILRAKERLLRLSRGEDPATIP